VHNNSIAPVTPVLQVTQAMLRAGTKQFGPFDFNVRHKERIAILGPSGAGKSTLLKLISKESSPYQGDVIFSGKSLSAWSFAELSHARAVLPQSHDVAFALPVDLVISLGRVARAHDPHLEDIVKQSATMACCAHLLDRYFDSLSGGEKARVQLARVFAQLWDKRDCLLLVDEPIAALDPGLQFDLLDAIDTFSAERDHTVLAVLHDVNHALASFDRLLLVKDGLLIGDHAANETVIPHLEHLYEIGFERMMSANGDILVKPVRQRSTLKVVSCK
jgi:iron complex transport system ATP-binding protein